MKKYSFGFLIFSMCQCASWLFVTPAGAQITDRYQLGVKTAGDVVELPLDSVIAPTRLLILVDGAVISTPFGVAGTTLSLRLPDDLLGARHQIVVFELTSTGRRYIGNWEFETAENDWSIIGSVMSEVGIRGTHDRTETYSSGGGRLDFNLNDGRFRGGLSFALDEGHDPITGDRHSVGDWFVETRHALAGQRLTLRFGTHYFDSDSQLFDQGVRRGASARVGDASGGHETTLFAVQSSQSTGSGNLLGLNDPQDRVAGFMSTFQPTTASGLRFTLSGYGGHDPELPHGGAGAANGRGLAVSGAVGTRGDFLLSADRSRWHDGLRWREGMAYSLDTSFDIAATDQSGGLVFNLGYERTDADFHSPLNRDQISGEETLTLGLTRHTWEWDWTGEFMIGQTNSGGDPALPVDRLMRLGVDVTYTPEVFTGGFLNGASFFAGAEMFMQDRIDTPPGAVAASDNTTYSVRLGLSRLQPDHSLALLYSYDLFEDRTGARQHRRIHGLESIVTFAPMDDLDTSFSSKVELNDGPSGRTWLGRGSGAVLYELIEDQLSYEFEFGVEASTDPAAPTGGYLGNALAWSVSDTHTLVLSADYSAGSKRHDLLGEDGWVFSFALRSDFDIARYR